MLSESIKLVIPENPEQAKKLAAEIIDGVLPISPRFNRFDWEQKVALTFQNSTRQATPEEHRLIAQAENFVTAEFKKAKITTITKCSGLLTEEYAQSEDNADVVNKDYGSAHPEIRSMYLNDTHVATNPERAAGTIVHELTHLSGAIKLGAKTWVSFGLINSAQGETRFLILEEFVADLMEIRFHKSQGAKEIKGNYKIKVTPEDRNPKLTLLAMLYGEIYQLPAYLEACKKRKTSRQDFSWNKIQQLEKESFRFSLQAIFPKIINLPSVILKTNTQDLHSPYGVAVKSILDLIPEISRCYSSKGDTRVNFENRMLHFHQAGNTKAALKYLCGAVGKSILLPLAYFTPKIDPNDSFEVIDNLLLRMYVDAGQIKEIAVRNQVRTAISYLTNHREDLRIRCKNITLPKRSTDHRSEI